MSAHIIICHSLRTVSYTHLLIHRLYENQIPVKDFYKQEPDLEEVFLAMIEDKEEEIYESR